MNLTHPEILKIGLCVLMVFYILAMDCNEENSLFTKIQVKSIVLQNVFFIKGWVGTQLAL